ncbi:MAG: hypothetical protein WCS84_18545, partial [Nocardioides sp.]
VCLHKERDLLERLLARSAGCYDDLVVVHDGPDESDVRSLVEGCGGRFFERSRHFQQEPHWPFAWAQARHDWVLRWDADEFPSEALRAWLADFRSREEPPVDVSAYSCILPLWDGTRARTRKWPQRIALIHRERVRYFGMADQPPVPDGRTVSLDLVLHHQPKRKCYGIRYTVARPKVRRWHDEIGRALLGRPTDLPCWRWDDPEWPPKWEQIRRRPLWTALYRFVMSPLGNAREALQCGEWPRPSFLTFFPFQHWLTCMSYIRMRRRQRQLGDPRT